MDDLPFHLFDEILFKLDPKSLAMMRCTERSTKSYISEDPYFMSEYLSRVEPGLLDVSTYGSSVLFCKPFGDSGLFKNEDSLEITSHILGSCSGLLLLFVDGLCVVNLLTKRFRFLDRSISNFLRYKAYHVGFAVDQIDRTTQRFKLVYLIERQASNLDETKYQFRISTGNSRLRLSKTTITCPSSVLRARKKPVYSNGSLHWLRNDGSILAFNPETEQARLIPIKFPPSVNSKILFTAADNGLAMVSVTGEVIYVYSLKNILTDPKWVLVKQIKNTALDKERTRYWNVEAYDGKCLVVRELKDVGYGVVHGYDLRVNKWGVMGSIPEWCDAYRDIYLFKPSFSSTVELNQKVDINMLTRGFYDKRISSLSKIMKLTDDKSDNETDEEEMK